MKKIIYYFSGTGNSLQVARDLSQLLGDTALCAIPNAAEINLSAEVMGIVFPVYLWGVPEMVLKFTERIRGDVSDKYFFAIATYKSDAGDAIGQLNREMKKSGIELSAGFTIPMPGNNIIYYDVEPQQVINDKLSVCRDKFTEIAHFINLKQEVMPSAALADRFIKTRLLHNVLVRTFHNADNRFWAEPVCTGCGICSKICPAHNITMVDYRPVWQHHCQQCTACINLCPNMAIQYAKTTKARQRYVNPNVNTSDLYR